MEKKSKIAGFLTSTILVISVLIFVVSLFKYVKNNGEVEKEFLFGIKPLYVTTDSMDPYIKKESLIFTKKYTFDDVHKGDVVLYYHDEKLFTHRVIEKSEEGLRTQGDNSDQMDAYTVTPEEVIGIVFIRMNWVANFLIWFKEGVNWLIFLSIIILVIGITVVINMIAKTTKRKREKMTVTEQTKNTEAEVIKPVPPVTNPVRRAVNYEETRNTSYLPDRLIERRQRR